MKFNKAIFILFLIFLIAILLHILLAFISFLQGKIYLDDLLELIISVTKIYSVHISILFAGSFFTHLENKQRKINQQVKLLSFSLTIIWNVILLASLFILLNISPPEDFNLTIEFQEKIANSTSFIITGLLSYFFVSKPAT